MAGQGSRNRGPQHTASSSGSTGRNPTSSSHGSHSRAPNHPGNIGGVAEPRPSYAGSVASSTATTHATTRSHVTPHSRTIPTPSVASSVAGDEGMWETVRAAGPPVVKPGTAWVGRADGSSTDTSSYRSASTTRVAPMDMKSNGWAKVAKVPKGKEQKWGEGNVAEEEGGEDIWAKYGRDIRDAKAGKVPKKKKKDRLDSDDD